jgi:hypothetical protein
MSALKVMFRSPDGSFCTAKLEFERNRAFVIFYEYGPKSTDQVIKTERVELDMRFLTKVQPETGVDYIYKKPLDTPEPGRN